MLGPSQLPPHHFSLLWGDDIVLSQALIDGVPILAMKDDDPPRLLMKVSQDTVVLLSQNPNALLCMVATEGKLRKHVFLFGDGFRSAAVIDYVQGQLALKHCIESPEVVMQPFTRVHDVDLQLSPYPGGILIRTVVSDCGTQNDYVAKGATVGTFEEP